MLHPKTVASGFVPPCIPTRAARPPARPDGVHEIKHDRSRLRVRRDGDAVRLFTRRGYEWSGRYPAIVMTAMQLGATSFTLDGEAVVCGPDGVAIFDALHRRGTVSEAMLYAFDLLALEGQDLRALPLATARSDWRGYWGSGASASSSASTPTRTAPRSSVKRARWALRGLYRSD
jgi:ATP-dependent DNA ligase